MNTDRSNDADALRARCSDPGFTPGGRDVEALVALWETSRQPGVDGPGAGRDAAKRIITALSRGDRGVATALVRGFAAANGPQRAMRLRVLTKISQRIAVDDLAALMDAALVDPEPKVVREAVRAIGKRTDPAAAQFEPALLAIAQHADAPERRAAVEALGRIAGSTAAGPLRSLAGGDDADLERRIAEAITLIERRGGREQPVRVAVDRALPSAVRVQLRCRRGVEDVVAAQLAVHAPGAAVHCLQESVSLDWDGALQPLYGVRSALDVGLSFPLAPGAELAARIVETLSEPALVQALRAWTDGTVRFRLAVAGAGPQRAVVWQVARALAERGSPLVNDSRAVAWRCEVDVVAGRVSWWPKGADDRFAYRRADVPAASHPTLAALLAWTAEPRAQDVVWDPFCGSGSELIECAKLAPGIVLVGSDTDSGALQAARKNVQAAGLDGGGVILAQGDARTFDPRSAASGAAPTLIITNPPMGRRVAGDGSVMGLLLDLVAHAGAVLAPGGRVVWLSPFADKTAAAGRRVGLSVTDRGAIDMGGFNATLQVMRRPS